MCSLQMNLLCFCRQTVANNRICNVEQLKATNSQRIHEIKVHNQELRIKSTKIGIEKLIYYSFRTGIQTLNRNSVWIVLKRNLLASYLTYLRVD